MKQRPATDVHLDHAWFVSEGVFAAATEQTQYLDVLDLLPANADAARKAVTYARDGGEVSLQGASLMPELRDEDYGEPTTGHALAPIAKTRRGGGLGQLVWQADGELRRVPAVLRGIGRDLRDAARKGSVPASVVPGAFLAGIVTTLLVGWVL